MERLTLLAWSLNVEKFPWRIRCDGEEPKFSWKHRDEVNQAPSNTWRVQQSRSACWNGSLCLGFTPQKSCRANQTNNQRTFTACCVFVFCFFFVKPGELSVCSGPFPGGALPLYLHGSVTCSVYSLFFQGFFFSYRNIRILYLFSFCKIKIIENINLWLVKVCCRSLPC